MPETLLDRLTECKLHPKQRPNCYYLLDDPASGQINTNDHMTLTQLLPRTQVMPSVDILPIMPVSRSSTYGLEARWRPECDSHQ